MENSVYVSGLKKSFKNFALNGVELIVPRGSVVGFIGENGAGKSTTIKSILGLVRPDGGEIRVFGKPCSALTREDKNKIGTVLGETALPENLNLKEIDRVMNKLFLQWDGEKFQSFAERFSLPRDTKVKDFSRGMRQKTAIAIALSHGAELLILDEPTTGLDPVVRDEILDLLYDFMQNEKHSVLISSHIISDLEKLCDYVAFMRGGKIVFQEEKDALYEKYAIWRGSREELSVFAPDAVVGERCGEYGTTALVFRDRVPNGTPLERAALEDVMLYFVKGKDERS